MATFVSSIVSGRSAPSAAVIIASVKLVPKLRPSKRGVVVMSRTAFASRSHSTFASVVVFVSTVLPDRSSGACFAM